MREAEPRILVLAQVFPPALGGSGRWLWELYRRLPAESVHIAAGHAAGDDGFDRSHSRLVTRVPLDFSNWGLLHPSSLRQYATAARHLDEYARSVAPTVVHCAKALPEGALGWWLSQRRGLPYWCYVHGEELTLAATSRELRWMTARVFAGACRLVANSRHTRALLVDHWGVSPGTISVLHPGVDTEWFVPAERDESIRARLGWSGRRVVLTVGALQKRKGQDATIRALPAIRTSVPDVLYAIAGEGWERGYLETLVRDLGVQDLVRFMGTPSDEDLRHCYQQCDVFVLPNRRVGWDFEGFGIVLLEAQACGRPVVTGRTGGTSETVDPGRTGVLVDGESVQEVGDAILELLLDSKSVVEMGRAGRAWTVSGFDWQRAAGLAMECFGYPKPLHRGASGLAGA